MLIDAPARAMSLYDEFVTFRGMAPVTLFDQFGRPVYVPSSAAKIGDTIMVKRPERVRL
jgi:hypothetical protein